MLFSPPLKKFTIAFRFAFRECLKPKIKQTRHSLTGTMFEEGET